MSTSSTRSQRRGPVSAVVETKSAYEQARTASAAADARLSAAAHGTEVWPLCQAVDDARNVEQSTLIDYIAAMLVERFPAQGIALLRCLGDATGLDIDIFAAVVDLPRQRRAFDRPALPVRARGRGAYPEGWRWWSADERTAWRTWQAAERRAAEAERRAYIVVPPAEHGTLERLSNTATEQWLAFVELLLARLSRALPAQIEAIAALAEESNDWALPAAVLAARRRSVHAQ